MRLIAWALTAMKWVFPCQETRVWSTSLTKDSLTRSVGWKVWLVDSRLRNFDAMTRRSSYNTDISRLTPDRSPRWITDMSSEISCDGCDIDPLLGSINFKYRATACAKQGGSAFDPQTFGGATVACSDSLSRVERPHDSAHQETSWRRTSLAFRD